MAVPEFHFNSLEQFKEKRDELTQRLSQSIERNESIEVRRDLEKQLEPVQERIDRLEEYIANRERGISEGKSI